MVTEMVTEMVLKMVPEMVTEMVTEMVSKMAPKGPQNVKKSYSPLRLKFEPTQNSARSVWFGTSLENDTFPTGLSMRGGGIH